MALRRLPHPATGVARKAQALRGYRPPGPRPPAGCACAGADSPVSRAQLDLAWRTDTAQRDRALGSLLADGLVEQTADGRLALAGEGQ